MQKNLEIRFGMEREAYAGIARALEEYADFEIGGMLIGHRKSDHHFVISEVTVADDVGQFKIASFVREPGKSIRILQRQFRRRQSNYIGEWHSHPRFRLYPSSNDVKTMERIIADRDYGVNFALLIITKFNAGKVCMAGFLFHQQLTGFAQATVINGYYDQPRVDYTG